ncbi:MAG: helix-turn-helix transcriptional regulator, partial [Bacteroidaceae bacterium]|nr:helix-turn-helix transcriptional regulator [Bacteroidaceae bacterium]
MKDRIRQLMLDQAMSQKSFASELCIAEATLSGIFNGRTRPSNQIVSSIHE